MKVALCAKKFINKNIFYNRDQILKALEEVPEDTELVCFGEAFLQGFDSLSWDYDTDSQMAVTHDSEAFTELCRAAKASEKALAFGYIERAEETLYSSYAVISKEGKLLCNYRRVSEGWKEPEADSHYREGVSYPMFALGGKTFSVGLCGDLWYENNVNAVAALRADVVLWPVYVDYTPAHWNEEAKAEYAVQAGLCGKQVLLINSVCDGENRAKGGTLYVLDGTIQAESLPGEESILVVEV